MGLGSLGLALLCGGIGLLGYTYVGYPLLTAMIPRRKPAPPQAQRKRSVSVVIAARAAGRAVSDKVQWLLENTESATQMVVVLDGPDPEAEAALAKLSNERLLVTILSGAPGKWAALNRGVASARGEVIVFADVRPRIGQGAIPRLVAALDSPDVGAAAAAFDTEPGSRPHVLELYWKLERWIRGNEAAFDSCIGTSGCLYAIERSCWKPLPAGLLLDDVWVPMHVIRAGKRVAYVPEARVVDVPYGSDETELARKVRTLTGNYQLLMWMPWLLTPGRNRVWLQFVSHKLMRLLTPAFTGAAGLGALLIALTYTPLAWFTAAVVAAVIALGLTPLRGRPLWSFGKTILVMHVALVAALANAVRRRWDVWEDPPRPTFSEVATR